MNHTIFISDLHLEPNTPQTVALFKKFMETEALAADAFYILGDFFEVWIGDDEQSEFNENIKVILKKFTQQKPLYFIPGNRDFLIGQQFAKETGIQILPDPTQVELYGIPTLLMHGDSLCTQDTRHQLFRRVTASSFFKKLFLSLPLSLRKLISKKIRTASKNRTKLLSNEIMDVDAATVKKIMHELNVTQLIHGHTHRPDIHQFAIAEQPVKRIVLGAWHEFATILICYPNKETELQIFS